MYNIEMLKRKIHKEGLQNTITFLTSPNLPENIKKDLVECNVFVNGYVNLTFLSSLL